MLRKGFTLIELLIVITIIAILAGAAIPYVQDYIDDARMSKARADLSELRNAIIRYEAELGKGFDPSALTDPQQGFQEYLVGPYLQSALTDPWGTPYYIATEASLVYSAGADRKRSTNIISTAYRPTTSPTRAYWNDDNNNGIADKDDTIDIYFTRPLDDTKAKTITNYTFTNTPSFYFDGATVENPHPITNATDSVRITLTDQCVVQSGIELFVSEDVTDTSNLAPVIGLEAVKCSQIPVIIRAAQ